MHLNEFTIGIACSLLITRRDGTACAGHRVCRLAKDKARAAGCHDNGVGLECFQLEALQVHCDQSTTNLMIVENERKHLPSFVLVYLSSDLPFPDLFIKCI